MRKRLITQKYLRDANKYTLKVFIDDEKDYYVSVKKIIKIDSPFILDNGLLLLDNGYQIVEIIPKKENYTMRVFFNDKKEILEYYFDITLENGFDSETKLPYYDDAFLDVTITNGKIEICDKDELENALLKSEITKEIYDFVNKTSEKLIDEIKNNNNKYLNMNIESYLE